MSKKTIINKVLKISKQDSIADTPISGLRIAHSSTKTDRIYTIYEPCVCFIVQGKKLVSLGDKVITYDTNNFLVSTLNSPIVGKVLEAKKTEPYVCLILKIEYSEVFKILDQIDNDYNESKKEESSLLLIRKSSQISDCFYRLIGTIGDSEKEKVLAPLIQKEILFYLLKSSAGNTISQLARKGTHLFNIQKASVYIRKNYHQKISIDSLSKISGMSVANFHKVFKRITTLSPLQYQKKIRLSEAKRILLTENKDVNTVAYQVGYESASQFSREYSREFGSSPIKEKRNLI